ncbi:hypothetical protein [Scytonema hofmannii]|nr:hypothetical protein [Scytonema hofmannii]
MVSQGAGKDEVLETATEVVQLRSGGCAGIDEIGWSHTLGKC